MTSAIHAALERYLHSPRGMIGEILIRRVEQGWELQHWADEEDGPLEVVRSARKLAVNDGAGKYRPLKTAPDLRRGWVLHCADVAAVRAALDYLYPAMLGVRLAHLGGKLPPVPLRETLGRQSGMYAATRKLTDEQAQSLIARTCRSDGGCLKAILWRIAPETAIESLPLEKFDPEVNQVAYGRPCIPLLCHEACNLLVAEARTVVKGKAAPEGS